MAAFSSRHRAVAFVLVFASCHRGSTTIAPDAELGTAATVAVDEPVRLTFRRAIDPASLFPATVAIVATDGAGLGIDARGSWRLAMANVLEFVPELPAADPTPGATSGGLQPATRYTLRVAGGGDPAALWFADGERLAAPLTFEITTRAGTVDEVFASQRPGGPRLVASTASPRDDAGRWRIGRLGDHAELRLGFDQPLDPRTANAFSLHYDDPVFGADTGIAVEVALEANTVNGATIVLRPRGVLPTSATLRLTIASTLRDLFGEDRTSIDPSSEPSVTLATEDTYAPLFDALLVDFTRAQDLATPDFPDAAAAVVDGALRVPEAFPVTEGIGDLRLGGDVVLRTDEQQIHYEDAPPRSCSGGVLHVRDLEIGAGAYVRGIGPNPLVFVVDGDANIDGVLSVRGSDGAQPGLLYRGPGDIAPVGLGGSMPPSTALQTPAGAGGGSGGRLPNVTTLGAVANGNGPHDAASGGAAGAFSCESCSRSSGGGGGAMATAGDPWFPTAATSGTSFVQRRGDGGYGCAGASGSPTRTLAGGAAGATLVDTTDPDDDFFGRSYEPRTGRARIGELAAPIGGGGGGSGGSFGAAFACDPARTAAAAGAPGGGGGGAIVLQVRGTLTIGATGRIDADGGNGALTNTIFGSMGGGGGGAGGMVVLMAREIVLHVRGETFANKDYTFVVSADGGVCRSTFFEPIVLQKYPVNGASVVPGAVYDGAPLGGFGGMGIVQLMVPPGTDNADGTNTVLDDHVTIVRNGVALSGAEKQRFLGWSGFRDDDGTRRDDFGAPITALGGQGDIRPAPLLLPLPYSTDGTARARSRWLPLGARQRRALGAPDGGSRGVIGDVLRFASPLRSDGRVPFSSIGAFGRQVGDAVFATPVAISRIETDVPFRGGRAHRVVLASAALLGTDVDRYAGYVAEMIDGPSRTWLRVVASERDALWLDADDPTTTTATTVQLRASFVDLASPNVPTTALGPSAAVPLANARIGFAFHRAPEAASAGGLDPNRLPTDPREWLFDLGDPALAPVLRAFGPSHVRWDVRFESRADTMHPEPATIALRRVHLPVRF